jgi:hypothetical protein
MRPLNPGAWVTVKPLDDERNNFRTPHYLLLIERFLNSTILDYTNLRKGLRSGGKLVVATLTIDHQKTGERMNLMSTEVTTSAT